MNDNPFDIVIYGQLVLTVAFLHYLFFPPDNTL
jgi:hypothetical protein